MKRQQNNLCVKDLSKIGKTHTRSSSSNYSTCSDDQNRNFQKINDDTVGESTILSGQIPCDSKHADIALGESLSSETAGSETSYSINILDQNIDVLAEDDDVFLDCNDTTISGSNDSSTVYIPIRLQSDISEVRSNNHFYDKYVRLNNLEHSTALNDKKNDVQKSIENKRFTTILEETEIARTTNSFRKKKSTSSSDRNRTEAVVVEVINKVKEYDNQNKHSSKKVLFINEDNASDDVSCRYDKILKSPHLLRRRSQCTSVEKVVDKNCNVHNTTESFVLWEKLCKASETSQSFNSECYGDDELSTTYKTLDDTIISNISVDVNEKAMSTRKFYRHRSKSCDSILREVRHLPHIVFDKFLKCLSEEIENIRKKNVVCTCKKSTKKSLNKENVKSSTRVPTVKVFQVENLTSKVNDTNSKLQPKVFPYKEVNAELRLSPRSVTNNPENISKNQKSPKTPTNSSQKRGFYSWQKEIVSPVGEYIRGKRESPFKNSPNKRKV